MKNNNIIKYIIVLTLSFFLTGCEEDVLDTEPYDKISEDVVWKNKANAETFIMSSYSILNGLKGVSTDARTLNLIGFDAVYNGSATVFNGRVDRFSDYGFNNWGEVRKTNLIIEKVSNSDGISEEDKKELIAEAKFLRAMSYYKVARSIGRIVWIDKVLKPEDDFLLSSTSNPTESYEYILKDLEEAIAGLPATKVPGRVNQFVAAAMYTEVGLQALAYQNYPDDPSIASNNNILNKVLEYGNMVINNGGYSLEEDYGGMFNDVNPYSDEIIYGIYSKSLNTYFQNTPMQLMAMNVNNNIVNQYGGTPLFSTSVKIFEGWIQHGPTQNLAEEYLVIDEQDPTKAVKWFETSQYEKAVTEQQVSEEEIPRADGETVVKSGSISPNGSETIFTLTNNNRDARWSSTIISDSTQFYGETITTRVGGNATRWLKKRGFAYYLSLSNLHWRKGMYTNVGPTLLVGTPTDYHWVITRLGKVYLNMAEAHLLKNEISNGVEMLNKTRVVHGQIPPSTANSSEEAWEDYKRERRVDLVLENDYYWSLLRWGRYGGDANHDLPSNSTIPELTEIPRVMDIDQDGDSFSILEGSFFGANDVREFNTKRYLLPIAQQYLDRNPNFGPQNPQWN